LGVDEIEALRLCDLDGLYHDKAAELIGVSRQTLGRILEQARKKVIEALVQGKALRIEATHDARILTQHTCDSCHYQWQEALDLKKRPCCPKCRSQGRIGLNGKGLEA
jgi:predicted Zn-ribbon and HTH transcriptional regulator